MTNRQLVIILLIISGVITIYFLASIILDGYWIWGKADIEYDKTGQVGDFIGGVVGTIISGAGFYFLYLTLNAQRIAILKQENAFERERFENRFYELIRIHRENVAELKFHSIEYLENSDKHTYAKELYEGKAVFRAIFSQFILLINESKHFFKKEERIYLPGYKEKLLANPILCLQSNKFISQKKESNQKEQRAE